jgi:heme exporter protein C
VTAAPAAPAHTGSRATRILGSLSLLLIGATFLFGLVLTDPDAAKPEGQGDAMRMIYVHVPSAFVTYLAFGITAAGSIAWLWKRSTWWDRVAASSAEIGVVYTALCLVTGSLWGRPTWGVYWDWDPRLTTTSLLFLLFLGYLAIRRLPADPVVRAKRSAIVGLVAFVDVPLVHYAVDWWRSLHQDATVGTLDVKLEGLKLFTFFLGMAAFVCFFAWAVVHRFRLAWLEDQLEESSLDLALAARRAEAMEVPA